MTAAVQGFDLVETGDIIDTSKPRPARLEGLSRRISRPVQLLRAVPHVGTWIGVLLAASGAILLVLAWVRTAALTNVALQIPYVVSAGFTGLGLIAVGLTVINIAAKQEDALERTRQVGELRGLLSELRNIVESDRPAHDTAPAKQGRA